ncbi:hypothetical protein [Enterococcus rotai]|uniref:hypothetical protein n=1 Tax=Enterococcus rotai TaxID=118060 RepID=UPI0032B54D71
MNKKFKTMVQYYSFKHSSFLMYMCFLVFSVLSIYFVLFANASILGGHDSIFHIYRIEGLVLALQQGDFFPRINYFFLEGSGYASSVFYSDLFLYPVALFRLLGLSIPLSYAIYISLINFATFVIGYKSFDSLANNKKKSFFFAVCYGLSSYRLSDVILRSAIGEILAFMVLPIAFVGLIHVVLGDTKKYYWLIVGMTLLFYSHMITTFIFCLFIVFLLVVNSKRLFKERNRLKYLFFSAVLTVLLVANNLFPMLEQIFFQPLKFATNPVYSLQDGAWSIGEYIWNAVINNGFSNIGILVLISIFILLVKVKNLSILNKQLLGLSMLFLVLSVKEFPQFLLEQTIFNMVQFPWRYFIMVTICISWILADVVFSFTSKFKILNRNIPILLLFFLIVSSVHFQIKNRLDDERARMYSYSDYVKEVDKYRSIWLGAGSEYLPSSAEVKNMTTAIADSKDTTISNYKREYNSISFDYSRANNTKVVVPFIYYKGYVGEVIGTDKKLLVSESPYFDGYCEVTVTGSGSVKVQYKWTLIQKISFAITGVTLVAFSISMYRNRKGYFMKKL